MKPEHFASLNLPEATVRWLLDFWDVIQGLDDWRDNQEITAQEKEAVIYKVMFLLPNNVFFQYHLKELLPLVSNLVLKWIGANRLEDNREHLHKAYMWRAAYYDLVLEVVRLVHGYEAATNASDFVAKLYGETFEDYVKEFQNA